jgi:hypothetical protein
MLITINETGGAYPVERVPYEDNYNQWINKFIVADWIGMCAFLDEKIDAVEKFSVATLFGKTWPQPLEKIYQLTQDETSAALLLGRIVLDRVIQSDTKWMSTRINLSGRELTTAFYWR